MNDASALLATPFVHHLGWTLIHFLWQGVLVGFIYAALRASLRQASPGLRYVVALCTLLVLTLLPIITLAYLCAGVTDTHGSLAAMTKPLLGVNVAASGDWLQSTLVLAQKFLQTWVPWTVPAWFVGVAVMAVRPFGGWWQSHRLLAHDASINLSAWQQRVARLAIRLGITRVVGIVCSTRISVPCVAGWLKPLILIPPSALTGLTPRQLEMVLAHELAHIRRHDYLINLLQLGVETLLFYHPVVRWVSQDIRQERELCCDDLAVQACDDALGYARALTELAGLRAARPAVILGVDGGALVLRVDRLISPHHHTIKIGWLKTLPVLVFVFGLGTLFTSRYMLRSPLPTPAATQLIPHIMSHPLISQMRIAPPPTRAEPVISQPIILKTHVAPTRIAKLALQPVTKLINMQIAAISSPRALPGYRPANTVMAHPPRRLPSP